MENEKDIELKKDVELSEDDLNWYSKTERILEEKGVIGRKKYNSLIDLRNRYNLHNENYPNNEPLKLSEIQSAQILQYETENILLSKQQSDREKEYLKSFRLPQMNVIPFFFNCNLIIVIY